VTAKTSPCQPPNTGSARTLRDLARIHRAAEAAGAGSSAAMTVALAQIAAAFDEAAAINSFKLRVERLFGLRADHPALRARFAARAAMLFGRDLDAAIVLVERWWRDERKAFQIASVFGSPTRLSLEVLRQLRIILRLLRFKRMNAEYDAVLTLLRDVPVAVAAE
jgi:hypothetical protein